MKRLFVSFVLMVAFFNTYSQQAVADSCDAFLYHFQAKKYKAAIAAAKICGNTKEREVNNLLNIGVCFDLLLMYDSALYYYNKAIAIAPNNSDGYKMRAVHFGKVRKLQLAEADIAKALSFKKNESGIYFSAANIYCMFDELSKAEMAYLEALKLKPNWSAALVELGKIEVQRKNYSKAMSWYNKAAEKKSFAAAVYNYRGDLHKFNCDYELALNDFSHNIINDNQNNNDTTLVKRAEIFALLRKPNEAKADLDKAKKINPQNKSIDKVTVLIARAAKPYNNFSNETISNNNHINILYNRAKQLLFERRLGEAFNKVDSAINAEPNNDKLYVLSGEILTTLFEVDYGLEASNNIKNFDFVNNVYWKQGIGDLNIAIEINKKNAMAFFWRANLYMQAAKWKEAISDLEKANKLKSADNRIKETLFWAKEMKEGN